MSGSEISLPFVTSLDASSEYLSAVDLTDTEDAGRHGTLVPTVQDRAGPQVTVMGDSYTGLSPMIIMNNFVLKQVNVIATALLPYKFKLNRTMSISMSLSRTE